MDTTTNTITNTTTNTITNTRTCNICTFINSDKMNNCQVCNSSLFNNTNNNLANLLTKSLEQINKNKLIENNYIDAHETIPESFFQVEMIHFPCWINDTQVKVFVDTGAQQSIMSKKFAEEAGISHLIDTRYNGVAKGVGEQKILGKIWLVDIDFGDLHLPCSFIILETLDIDVIFGLNMLISHGCIIDCKNKCITTSNMTIPFISK